jgi:hypothetical protein
MADLLQQSEGVVRAADAALRTSGGRAVLLRMAAPASVGDDAEQLGLATPQFNDMVLAPCVFHKADSKKTLLVAATAVDAIVGSLAFDSADVLFETAAGVAIDEVLYQIADSIAWESMGQAYCYRLTLVRKDRD